MKKYILIFIPLLYISCDSLLLKFASMKEYKVSKTTIDSFYLTNFKTTKQLEFGNKNTIESVWKVGGMPIVYIIDSTNKENRSP